jgi:4-hydroxy-2-oxoheptanedioate aldolase
MEHSPITLETARNMILATRGSRTMPFIRVPVVELWTAKRVMDMGALGIIFPFVSTPEQAKTAAAACKYPPNGSRGSGAGLATFRWPAPGGYYDFADQNIVVVTNIEDTTAMENIETIAATRGLTFCLSGRVISRFRWDFAGNRIILYCSMPSAGSWKPLESMARRWGGHW